MAFPRAGVTDASPLGAANPLGTPSADSARNVIALAVTPLPPEYVD